MTEVATGLEPVEFSNEAAELRAHLVAALALIDELFPHSSAGARCQELIDQLGVLTSE